MPKSRPTIASAADLRGLCARDVMTPDPLTVTMETPLSEVLEIMERKGFQHFPIVEAGRLVGVLSERYVRDAMPSILTVADAEARRSFLKVTQVSQVAVRNPPTCSPDSPLSGVISTMQAFRVGSLPVVEVAKLVGIITARDLIGLLGHLLKSSRDW
jgi:acetoin utilization protein AcuB